MQFPRSILVMLLLWSLTALSQTKPENTAAPAPNAWMLTPTPYLEWNKSVPAGIRAARDQFQDGMAGDEPLTAPHARAPGPGIGDGIPPTDIRPIPERVVLTGRFKRETSVLSGSQRSLYTEVTVQVDKVFENQAGSAAAANRDVTILIAGGTVRLASGKTLTYDTDPIPFSLQPDHTYLLVLTYEHTGDFYVVMEDWDISDGTVRPNTSSGVYRAKHGMSALSGLPVEKLDSVLGELLYTNQR